MSLFIIISIVQSLHFNGIFVIKTINVIDYNNECICYSMCLQSWLHFNLLHDVWNKWLAA